MLIGARFCWIGHRIPLRSSSDSNRSSPAGSPTRRAAPSAVVACALLTQHSASLPSATPQPLQSALAWSKSAPLLGWQPHHPRHSRFAMACAALHCKPKKKMQTRTASKPSPQELSQSSALLSASFFGRLVGHLRSFVWVYASRLASLLHISPDPHTPDRAELSGLVSSLPKM